MLFVFYKYFLRVSLFLLCLPLFLSSVEEGEKMDSEFSYRVEFKGIEDKEIICLLQSNSQLMNLIDSPPLSIAALKRRAKDDISNALTALQSLGFYNAHVDVKVDSDQKPALVTLAITTGPIYNFASFRIVPAGTTSPCSYPFEEIDLEMLGIVIGEPALPSIIIEANETLQQKLEKEGYPLSKLIKREVIADEATKTIAVILHVDSGPLAIFGQTDITGDETIFPCFFERKIAWRAGEYYNPVSIARTISALEASNLFSSINITHDDAVQPDGTLPMHITVQEARHRSVGFGVGYATDLGPGFSAEWEHRNMRGMGDKLSCVANLWLIKQQGFVRYVRPDFCCPKQDLIWKAEVEHEITKGFREASASLSGTIERQLTDRLRISYGGMYTWLRNTHSNNNRSFNLIKAPMQLMWNGTNSLLDPTIGNTLHLKTTPALQVLAPCFAYTTHQLTTTAYLPLDCDHRFVLAGKAALGSIWGTSNHSIPPSERFYAGSDTLLRGYRYMTVSPLGFDHKPIGGRSLMVYSLEMRMRIKDPFGIVAFYDVGNVYAESLPQFGHKQLQSLGVGLRYHTPVGPLRLDIAFPLNPRRHLDSAFQIYFSIGQSF